MPRGGEPFDIAICDLKAGPEQKDHAAADDVLRGRRRHEPREPVYRVLSFLVLGTVLLIVSLVFTRLRKRQRGGNA